MNKRDVLEVAVKIMGLYCLVWFLVTLNFLGMALSSADEKSISNKVLYVLFSCLAPFLYLVFATAFLRGGKRIAERLTPESGGDLAGALTTLPSYAYLHFWIRLLGLYFFVSVVGHLVSDMAQAGILYRSPFWGSRLIGEILQLGISLAFVFRSTQVAKLVEGSAEQITGANPD